jgi:hypothetical protein
VDGRRRAGAVLLAWRFTPKVQGLLSEMSALGPVLRA